MIKTSKAKLLAITLLTITQTLAFYPINYDIHEKMQHHHHHNHHQPNSNLYNPLIYI
jgi:hypothetical protein